MSRITIPRQGIIRAVTPMLAIVVAIVTYGSLRGGSTGYTQISSGPMPEIELITLRPAGFEPTEIIRPKGSFVLFVDDRSGKQNSLLLLQSAKDERVRAINLNRKKSEWNDVLDLSPGTYVLHDAGNPELNCQITILP